MVPSDQSENDEHRLDGLHKLGDGSLLNSDRWPMLAIVMDMGSANYPDEDAWHVATVKHHDHHDEMCRSDVVDDGGVVDWPTLLRRKRSLDFFSSAVSLAPFALRSDGPKLEECDHHVELQRLPLVWGGKASVALLAGR